ncbi:ABC transporter permease [Dactylosporangium sp. CS-033363]|uniref:ABC transporter permease n=1 Tax=Dactylosporangium sp. CS-033363 TaxID=3239935 RepID=UPI003D8CD7C2
MPRRPRTPLLDVLVQAGHAIAGRRTRSALTATGIALGISAVVATVGISATAAGAISDRFDALKATRITAQVPAQTARPTPANVAEVRRLNGVRAAGALCTAEREVRLSRLAPPAEPAADRYSLVAAQPAALDVLGVRMVQGRAFDDGHGARRQPVALLDSAAARSLGVAGLDGGQTVYLAGVAHTVLGIFAAPADEPRLTQAIVVPYETCLDARDDTFATPQVVVRTDLGAADQAGHELPLALHPEDPGAVTVLLPPDLRSFRAGVEGDTRALFLGLAFVSLVIAAVGVSNTTLVSVLDRRAEIGLRRAVGASRRAVAGQFLVESGALGLAGGLLGTVVGLDVTAAVALARGWLVTLDPALLAECPALGLAVGMLAGLYPAYAAARVAPAATLRGE